MAEIVTIDGQSYVKRDPLGVLGLSLITFGIYFFYWYYKVNDEMRRFERDDSISPMRSLMAMIFGWMIIVPPFIAMYNTAKHVRTMEERVGIQQQLEPALAIVLMFVFSIGNGIYLQEHLNRAWARALGGRASMPPGVPPAPPPPPPMPGPPGS
jgi:hypothetical protein